MNQRLWQQHHVPVAPLGDCHVLGPLVGRGETSMAVTSGTGTAPGDIIGVAQDDGTIQWTTIASGDGTTTLVLAAGLTDAAADGNKVYVMRWKAMANLAS